MPLNLISFSALDVERKKLLALGRNLIRRVMKCSKLSNVNQAWIHKPLPCSGSFSAEFVLKDPLPILQDAVVPHNFDIRSVQAYNFPQARQVKMVAQTELVRIRV